MGQRKEYRKNNIEKIKQYRLDNQERINTQTRKYREVNKERVKEVKLKYYIKNKEKLSTNKRQHIHSKAVYEKYKDKLTIDESPRLSKDGVSLEVKCRYCGKYFIPSVCSANNRMCALNSTKEGQHNLYCSYNCKKACPIFGKIKYPKKYRKASSREVDSLTRQLCLERDCWECQKCGATQKDSQLHVHHIKSYTQNKILGNDVDNCITFCKKCHKEVHRQDGCKYHELKC